MKLSAHFRRHLLTIIAVAVMISSAVLSFFFVQENDRRIAELKRNEETMDQSIRTYWEDAAQAERNADAAVIVSLLVKDGAPEAAALKQYYLARAGVERTGAPLMDVLKAAGEARRHAVDKVNDTYISRVEVENEIMIRESANKRSANIAFLLQLIGLVLVILTREVPGA
jgi:positive regulator of sigma E activity